MFEQSYLGKKKPKLYSNFNPQTFYHRGPAKRHSYSVALSHFPGADPVCPTPPHPPMVIDLW